MKSAATGVLIFLTTVISMPAQPPIPGATTPIPLFSAEAIQSLTPSDNPITDAKARLGDMIFDEKRVSADNSVACNTCHSPRNGFTTHTATSRGVGDQIGKRNAPSILNAMFYNSMFWDGRAATLEDTSDRFAELRAAELDRQRTSYQYRLEVEHEAHKGSR